MTLVTNFNEPAIAFLFARMGGVEVTGPRLLPARETAGALDKCCIVQATGGPNVLQPPQRQCLYVVRCYGDSDDDALAVYGALVGATTDSEGWPVAAQLVGGKWWLYRVQVAGPAGPEPDPEADWPVVATTATMVWSMVEVA